MTPVKAIAVGLFALFLLVLASGLQSGAALTMSVALALVPTLSYIVGRKMVQGLECSREVPPVVHEDDPTCVHVHLRGKHRLLGTIELDDTLPDSVEVDKARGKVVEHLHGEVQVSYTVTPRKRGEYAIGPLKLRVSDPLGFFKYPFSHPHTSPLIVLPRPLHVDGLRIRPMGFSGEHQFEGTGAKGSGIDFHGIRLYQYGDELRRVHWRSTAKHGTLNVVEFEHTKAEDAVIVIDLQKGTEVGTGRFTTLEYAVKIAAGLAEQALDHGSCVRLAHSGASGPAAVSSSHRGHLYMILDALARVRADRNEPLSSVLAGQLSAPDDSTTVVCVCSTLDNAVPGYVAALTAGGVKVQFILLSLADSRPGVETQRTAYQLMSAGANITLVECSTSAAHGKVRYDYGE